MIRPLSPSLADRDYGSIANPPGTPRDSQWLSRQVEAMTAAWDRGESVSAADVIGRFPDIDPEFAIRLIYEEVSHRREAGLVVDTEEIVRRYSAWGDELRALFDCDRLLGPSVAFTSFPEIGEVLGPFRLLAELGRGASGRTFLASDPGLADRHVVVKVIPDDQEEHLALARLRHTHIVPLFSEHTFPDRGLRVLCMPYLGGTSLAKILMDLAGTPLAKRTGKRLVELIDENTHTERAAIAAPFRRSLEQASYVQAVTWIAACLADALHYAHTRGLVHMDVKPSNVIITVDGQPVLLDFHLSRPPIQPGDWVAGRIGGTPGWMSPEQTSALDAVESGRPVTDAVDGRADIFALGLLLRDALAAPHGTSGDTVPRDQSGTSVGLLDIVSKCLAPLPSDRYDDAATLAEDLRRHLNDLPLQGVGNRSLVERGRKWRRRHPGALAWAVAALSILLTTTVALAVVSLTYRQRVGLISVALQDGRRYRAAGQYDEALHTLKRGLDGVGGLPGTAQLWNAIRDEIVRVKRGRTARELHDLADLIRFRYGLDLPTRDDAQALAQHCRTIWSRRQDLMSGSSVLDDAAEQQIKTDLREVASVWADLAVRLSPASNFDQSRHEALGVLEEAERAFGSSPAINLRRQQLGAASEGSVRAPKTAWEHDDLGRYLLRTGRIETAAEEFQHALALRPQDFWSNFYQGICAYRLNRPREAVAAFRTCLALAPRSAICQYNRALAYDRLGEFDLAYADYTRAVELDSQFASPLLNRGILLYDRGRHRQAADDFERALGLSPLDRQTAGSLHYNLALAQRALGDLRAAQANADDAVSLGCEDAGPLLDALHAGRSVSVPTGRRESR